MIYLLFQNEQKRFQEVFGERTEYSHCVEQECFSWIPTEMGVEAWKGIYDVSKNRTRISGASSTTDMSILYTCTHHGCLIYCPCSCCGDKKVSCKKICKNFPCEDCSSQCTEHSIRLPRIFDPARDHYTMVTDNINSARYVIPYTNILRTCQTCTRDVYEHQILHHVFHGRCKFCVMEMRPMKYMKDDTSLKAYKKAVSFVNYSDERTCAHCLTKLSDSYERKLHEKVVHEKVGTDHKCTVCGKLFTNSTSLKYHVEKHSEPIKYECDLCSKLFLSKNGLEGHKGICEGAEANPRFLCDKCNKAFKTQSNLARHKRVVHYACRGNREYAECFQNVVEIPCDQCEKVFKRTDVLKRHKETVHDGNIHNCPSCGKSFGRKDKLTKHMKSDHPSQSGD